MTVLYGIKNCDTVKKARTWLEQHNIDYRFHDFRVDGLDDTQIKTWIDTIGLETLINKRSTTWKELDDQVKNNLDNTSAVTLIAAHPTLIKRPLLDTGSGQYVGFKVNEYTSIFN